MMRLYHTTTKGFIMKQTITSIKNAKNNRKLTIITAYDALFAKLFEI